MKPDVEGEYVANIIERKSDKPRSLPKGSLLRLYFLPPNSRYAIFVGFFFLALEGVFFFIQPQPDPYPTSTAIVMVLGGIPILFAFVFPLLNMRRIRNAIQLGVSAVGRVDSVKNARITTYSTPEGMRHGSIKAMVSYTVNGQEHRSEVFLDRPWVSAVETGTRLRLLVDPHKPSILYVVGIAEQRHKLS